MSRRLRTAPAVALASGLASGLALLAIAGCGSTGATPATVQNLDRPVDVAFACYGNVRQTGDGVADATDPLSFQPQPLASCVTRTGPSSNDNSTANDPDHAPPGQEDLTGQPALGPSMRWFVFALQSASGTVAVADANVKGDGEGYQTGEILVRDGDQLVPGKNALSVGSQPVAIAGDPSGCFMMTANAGSCDLSVIDVERVVERSTEPVVRRQALTTAAGAPLLGRPAAMVADVRDHEIGAACPADPIGLLYIAYPDCHAVAIVDATTGAAVASIRFDDAGTATLGDGNLACPAQCGTRVPTTDGARPVSLDLMRDDDDGTRRLAIGLDNRPVVTVVNLDAAYLPVAVEQVELEGDVGVIDVAITRRIGMGGAGGWEDPALGTRTAQFVYAVATDASVRVVEVSNRDHECDTQIDPRYLRGVTASNDLICFAPGQVGTPPRRAFARGPGIELPGDDAPLSVVVTDAGAPADRRADPEGKTLAPTTLIGHFAFVSSTLGRTYVVNIDDDNYVDTFLSEAPLLSQLALAMPHQLRDAGSLRDAVATTTGTATGDLQCGFLGPDASLGGPRAAQLPVSQPSTSVIANNKRFELPGVRQLRCMGTDAERALPEVMYATPPAVRADVFPDLRATRADEIWSFQYEGSLSLDGGGSAVDGPSIRSAKLTLGGGAIRVADPARPFCAAGVEPYDYVQLRGCDPTLGNRQCGLGEVCYVHPEAATGACLPADEVDQLASACRDYLVSVRRYAVQQATSGELVLSERRRVLRTSPVAGCTSTEQCTELADYAESLTSVEHPGVDASSATPPTSTHSYTCGPDPTRAPGINRCMETCQESSDCDDGTICSDGFCLEGTIPAPACLGGLQRYSLHATEALVAVGSLSGYIHPIVEGAGGQCVKDPAANPLTIGRVPLTAPPCSGDGVTDILPNPCKVALDQAEVIPADTSAQCLSAGSIVTVPVEAIRFRNQAMTLNIVDPTYPGDRVCRHDRQGGRVGIPVLYPGYAFSFELVSGFVAQLAGPTLVYPSKLVRSPDGVVWAIDEGDLVPLQSGDPNTRGQIMRVDPDAISSAPLIR